jgi:hypothetical protein
VSISERLIEVIDDKQTGETILDEALKMMKGQQTIEKLSINAWIDLLSGMVPLLFDTVHSSFLCVCFDEHTKVKPGT